MSNLKGQVCVVTGASSGIGRATALELASEGAHVCLVARREEPLEAVAAECRKFGVTTLICLADVSDVAEVDAVANEVMRRYGRIDAWVNNAGVYVVGAIEETPIEAFRRVMDVNYFGVVYGTRAAVRCMKGAGRGAIVNISSELGAMGGAYLSAYTASKFAVRGFSDCVRQELRGTGVSLSVVMPVGTDTPLFEHGANYTGRGLKPPAPVDPPERVAKLVASVIRRPRAEAFVNNVAPVFASLFHFAPSLFDGLMRRQVELGSFTNEREPRSPGNMYEPMASGTDSSGGFGGTSALWLRRAGVLGAAALGTYALARAATARSQAGGPTATWRRAPEPVVAVPIVTETIVTETVSPGLS